MCVCERERERESILLKRETEHLCLRPLIHGTERDPFAERERERERERWKMAAGRPWQPEMESRAVRAGGRKTGRAFSPAHGDARAGSFPPAHFCSLRPPRPWT